MRSIVASSPSSFPVALDRVALRISFEHQIRIGDQRGCRSGLVLEKFVSASRKCRDHVGEVALVDRDVRVERQDGVAGESSPGTMPLLAAIEKRRRVRSLGKRRGRTGELEMQVAARLATAELGDDRGRAAGLQAPPSRRPSRSRSAPRCWRWRCRRLSRRPRSRSAGMSSPERTRRSRKGTVPTSACPGSTLPRPRAADVVGRQRNLQRRRPERSRP